MYLKPLIKHNKQFLLGCVPYQYKNMLVSVQREIVSSTIDGLSIIDFLSLTLPGAKFKYHRRYTLTEKMP